MSDKKTLLGVVPVVTLDVYMFKILQMVFNLFAGSFSSQKAIIPHHRHGKKSSRTRASCF